MIKSLLSKQILLQAIRDKSQTGAEGLYDQYAQVLGLAIFRIVQDPALTAMLLEKTILKIWDTAGLYSEQQQPLLTWMLGIARNLANEQIVPDKLEIEDVMILI